MSPNFNLAFEPVYGEAVEISEGISRITASNSGPFTFKGTNTYIVGSASLAIIDPGPADDDHFAAVERTIDGRRVEAIVLTHTHLDHTPLTKRLADATGATVLAIGPHQAYRELNGEETQRLGRSADLEFEPDERLNDGDTLSGTDWSLEVVATPGHTANHAAFGLVGSDWLFSGDHVMGWSTTVVAPPDGAMSDYMRSLDTLLARNETRYLPGHGDFVTDAKSFVKGLKAHRLMRERAITEQLEKQTETIPQLVEQLYSNTPSHLHGAAAMTILAHLEALVESGRVRCDHELPNLDSKFQLA